MTDTRARPYHQIALLLGLLAAALMPSQPARAQDGIERATVTADITPAALRAGETATLSVVLDIKPDLHAQSHEPLNESLIPLTVTVESHLAVEAGEIAYPEPEFVEYDLLGEMSVYTGQVRVDVPITAVAGAPDGTTELTGSIRYQLCDDRACFMPETVPFGVAFTIEPGGVAAAPDVATAPPAAVIAPGTPAWSIPVAFGAALLAGLLFNVMPCVLPVLPLKAVGFYEVAGHHRGQSILYGLVFSAGVIAVFGVLALLVLVLDVINWGDLFRYGWFIWSIVALLVLMALSLFGVFTIMVPSGTYSFTPRHDTYAGNFAWGSLTAVLATPCTAPLLPPLLLWATAQPRFVGVPAMLLVGVGMAIPYLLLSATPELARRMPRVGPWAELFKQMMGFLMLAAAAYFAAGRLIHGPGFFWVVLAVVAVACLYLVARTAQLSTQAPAVAVSSVIAVAALGATFWWTGRITGLFARPSMMAFAAPTTQPGGNGGDASLASGVFHPYSDDLFARARASGRPVLVKFTANWCATCQVIEGTVFQDPGVWAALQQAQAITLKVDMTEPDAPGEDLLLRLNPAGGIPLTAVYAPDADQPIVLASVYTSSTLLETLAQVTNAPAQVAAK